MATIHDLKDLVNSLASTVNTVAETLGIEADASQLAKHEIGMFMMYLASSDGELKWSEASLIGEVCALDLTPQILNNFIQENNIYSTEFESKPPISLKLLLEFDNKLVAMGKANEISDFAPVILNAYEAVADFFMEIDGNISENERADCNIYIDMMKKYIDEHSVRRKGSVYGITKNSGVVSAPAKSGVSAPRKKG